RANEKRLPAITGSLLKCQRLSKREAKRQLHRVVGRRVGGVSRRIGSVRSRIGRVRRIRVDSIHVGVHGGVIQDLVGGHGFVDVHGVVGGFVLATSRNRQGRTSDQDKSTHSKLPNYLRSGARVPRHKS